MPISAQSVIRRATDALQDPTSIRWPVDELVRWLNDAQRAIVKIRPDALNTMVAFRCSLGSRQSLKSATATGGNAPLAAAPAKLIEIPRNVAATSSKRAVTMVPRHILDAQLPGWHALAPSVNIDHYMFDPRDPTTFYTYPPASDVAELEVMYSAYPTDITEPAPGGTFSSVTGNLALADIYADDVLNLVLSRCYSKDAEYTANAALADKYMAMVTASLGAEIAATLAVQPQAKPGAATT